MDTGKGYFEQFESMEALHEAKTRLEQLGGTVRGVFTVGEEIEIKGSHFKVQQIWPRKLVLKLLAADPL